MKTLKFLFFIVLFSATAGVSAVQFNQLFSANSSADVEKEPAEESAAEETDSDAIPAVELDAGQIRAADIATASATNVIPAAAVVWFKGQAWVYRQTAANTFARESLRIDTVDADGSLRTKMPLRDSRALVVRGAELLLAQERKHTDAFEAE